ncbi:metal-sensing transcriptional repressor [Acetobacter oeni]|uniref:Metal resistance protein n=1 Tax=Acetobacter oeni TaxID=304077 RepID=A0A511XFR7_9PROT|nr:metal-sensing transcriptional repressor [Acetobacter oeni]MBB3882286.1 hypothetical protein NreA [Acetobacter oeni]NHO18039.1 metal-sensing transcriptional repressor [Acetobacter oeni]GBR01102.1 hypothetical protein AA21952_0313 [Acetobacter oeni LMG 21952]GEN61794.1 metal resistance protein [Acetobacter oeni]
MTHDTHPLVQRRLKQAFGHLARVMAMVDAGRSCSDLAQQLEAIESTIRNAKRELIRDHLEHCIIDAIADGNMSREDAIQEFSFLTKYF